MLLQQPGDLTPTACAFDVVCHVRNGNFAAVNTVVREDEKKNVLVKCGRLREIGPLVCVYFCVCCHSVDILGARLHLSVHAGMRQSGGIGHTGGRSTHSVYLQVFSCPMLFLLFLDYGVHRSAWMDK